MIRIKKWISAVIMPAIGLKSDGYQALKNCTSQDFMNMVGFHVEDLGFSVVDTFDTDKHCKVYLQSKILYKVLSYNFESGQYTVDCFTDSDMNTFGFFKQRNVIPHVWNEKKPKRWEREDFSKKNTRL